MTHSGGNKSRDGHLTDVIGYLSLRQNGLGMSPCPSTKQLHDLA